jgi:glycosyltransferase involved in cell wall biosynthesis
LRILFLAPQPFLEVRGTPLAVLAMLRALGNLGHQVELLSYPQGDAVELPGLLHRRSLRLPVGRVRPGPSLAKLALDVPFMLEAYWRMASGRFDVVHAVEEAAHLAAPLARLLRLPLVVDVDSSIPDQLRESRFATRGPLVWVAERLERHALGGAAAVITVCTSLSEGVRRTAPATAVFQIEDPPLAGPAGPATLAAADTLRTSLALDARPVVFYSGNFEPYQGVELLVDTASRVPDVQFLFMGGEPAEIAALRERAVRGGAGGRCLFSGKRSPSELPSFLALASVLASPRLRGANTPFKLYTYLASGKPVVATRISSHTQLLDDSLAYLVEPTPDGLAQGILQALAEPAEAGRRARRGLELVEREFSAARHAEKVRDAYAAVATAVAERRSRAPA